MRKYWVVIFGLVLSACASTGNVAKPRASLPVAFYDQIVSDIERIQPRTDEKFYRLEMSYASAAKQHRAEFIEAETTEDQISALQQAYYAYHDAHFIQLDVEGIKLPQLEDISLPFRLMPKGDRLSEARFRVFYLQPATDWVGDKPQINDELISIDGESVQQLLQKNRDRFKDSNPVGLLFNFSAFLTRQISDPRFIWETYPGRRPGQIQKWKFLRSGKEIELSIIWQKHDRARVPIAKNYGEYHTHFLIGKDGDESYGLELTIHNKKYLVIHLTGFIPQNQVVIDGLTKTLLDNAYRKSLSGVVLDFSQNGGGDDQAFPFLYAVIGKDFHLNWQSTPNLAEYEDPATLKKVSISDDDYAYFQSERASTLPNHFFKSIPFDCARSGCLRGNGMFLESVYGKGLPINLIPLPTVFVSSPFCGSKCDEIAKIFSAQDIGPIVGLPNGGLDGRFNELYKTYSESLTNSQTVKVTLRFVPTVSTDMNCKLTMGIGEPVGKTIAFETMLYDPGKTHLDALSALRNFHPKRVRLCTSEEADAVFKNLLHD